MSKKKLIVWFEEVGKEDINLVGGKGANLGEMLSVRLPVPYGFILTSQAYFYFLKQAGLEQKIKSFLQSINYDNPVELREVANHIRQLILKASIPQDLINNTIKYYDNLLAKENYYFHLKSGVLKLSLNHLKNIYRPPLVAIRSSATAEDLPTASFAGQQETYLNIKGESALINSIRECWASLFTERAIFYRHQNKFDQAKVGLAVVVQRMIQSEKSGVAFSIDPVTNYKFKIVIEAIYGLGEYIVQGKVTPDHYEVDKRTYQILKKDVKYQNSKLIKFGRTNKEIKLNKKEGSQQKLTDEQIIELALLINNIERHYYFPQDIEWALEKNKFYIVQSRPVTTIKDKNKTIDQNDAFKNDLPILTGSPASPGIATGPVKIILSAQEIDKIKSGEIMVARQTNPDFVPAMKKCAGIITEQGGRTSHAAIVSRELGIPAVVGVTKATKVLKNGQIVTINGITGDIFKGSIKIVTSSSNTHLAPKTNTKVYINLAEPEKAEKMSQLPVDGVGLLRAEFIIAQIGTHPKEFIKNKRQNIFIDKLTKNLLFFVKNFNPRPIIYRATDFKTNEYRNLKGGEIYEPKEENPMLGFRGASRYIANPEVFLMELEAIKKIWQMGYRNLHLMIPFVRLPWELIKIKTIIRDFGLFNYKNFKLLIMVEVPACALNLEEFLKIGIDGVSVGTNDLTMMLLGVDRDNEAVQHLYDDKNPVVFSIVEYVINLCRKYQVSSSICGQAASDYPDLIEKLIKAGITSVSVNPDAVYRTKELIYNIERKLNKK
ncbi:MAG: phosphoenolpyruvate synthase [Microgenomates group bacterium]|nr:phosphoenolpyruvate synthase [Microgenomates group bacterium]